MEGLDKDSSYNWIAFDFPIDTIVQEGGKVEQYCLSVAQRAKWIGQYSVVRYFGPQSNNVVFGYIIF